MSENLSWSSVILLRFAFSLGVGYSPTQCIKAKSRPLNLNIAYTSSRMSKSAPAVEMMILLLILTTSFRRGQSSTEQLATLTICTPASSISCNDSLSKGVAIEWSPHSWMYCTRWQNSFFVSFVELNLLTNFKSDSWYSL